MFGFAFISAEDLILQKLPTKAAGYGAEPISGTHGLAELLKDNPEYLTLDWVMEILLEEIEKYPNQPILVDLIPNLKFMMRVDGFIKKCNKEMEEFERKVIRNCYTKLLQNFIYNVHSIIRCNNSRCQWVNLFCEFTLARQRSSN